MSHVFHWRLFEHSHWHLGLCCIILFFFKCIIELVTALTAWLDHDWLISRLNLLFRGVRPWTVLELLGTELTDVSGLLTRFIFSLGWHALFLTAWARDVTQIGWFPTHIKYLGRSVLLQRLHDAPTITVWGGVFLFFVDGLCKSNSAVSEHILALAETWAKIILRVAGRWFRLSLLAVRGKCVVAFRHGTRPRFCSLASWMYLSVCEPSIFNVSVSPAVEIQVRKNVLLGLKNDFFDFSPLGPLKGRNLFLSLYFM